MISKNYWVQLQTPHKTTQNQTRCLSTLSKGFLNFSSLGVTAISLGSPFQCPITLPVKKPFPISNLTLPCPLHAIHSGPVAVTRERRCPLLPLWGAVGQHESSPQSSLPYAEQTKGPQTLLTRLHPQDLLGRNSWGNIYCPHLKTLI